MKNLNILFCGLLFLFFMGTANATVITADATGNNNYTDTDFWGVSFDSGTGYIKSVTFDLTPFGGDFFDFDGDATYNNATAPVIGSLTGLNIIDITPVFSGSHPTVLSFDFAANAFGAGDAFRFSADVDQIVAGNGFDGLLFSVVMQDDSVWDGIFFLTQVANQSAVRIETPSATVPVPATVLLMGLGLLSITGLNRRRQ